MEGEQGVRVSYDAEHSIALLTVTAGFPIGRLLGAYADYWKPHADFKTDASVIWDLSAVTVIPDEALEIISAGLKNISSRMPDIRVAYVIPGDLGFGFMRMFVSQADYHKPSHRAAFRSVADARAWLEQEGSP